MVWIHRLNSPDLRPGWGGYRDCGKDREDRKEERVPDQPQHSAKEVSINNREVDDDAEEGKLADGKDTERREGINDVVWSPDSEYLVSGSDDHAIHVWAPSQSPTTTTTHRFGNCSAIPTAFDETVKVWDFLGGKLLRALPSHSEVVSCLEFSRDG
ncbi:hypothetical protein PTTG_26505 [Puccinia triticina 1-1 BBBD Race 1]|uniref:Anaphase-promoting complex subunit 4 WD40 domain-containing protein n=1 Tax=Puccinia triticina (isolate 1-1 / race 1 (BBBD)) TaxID=630390 RepID=A0A180GSY0_PUCT1|nr:hypothetical protein PTTG_26505 [Puccinia triticina 1-1 BBBD Race 1]